jgi:glucosyl-3-phosphoglycerate phosphatase
MSGSAGAPRRHTEGTRVYLARHGRTELNESGVLRGLLDPPLDDEGHRQAKLLGQALGPRQPALVAASPLRRARQTAQPVAECAGRLVTVDPCLTDRDYGRWAGTPKETVVAMYGTVDAAPGVEPRSAIRDRAVRGLTNLAQHCAGGTVVVVSHDAVNREVLVAIDPGLGDPDALPQDNGCFNTLDWSPGGWAVLSINELPARADPAKLDGYP